MSSRSHGRRGGQMHLLYSIARVVAVIAACFLGLADTAESVSLGSAEASRQQTLAVESHHSRALTVADCTSTKVAHCTRKCKSWRNKANRVHPSCALGDVITASKANPCFTACEEDDSCTHVETWRVKGSNQLHCQLYSCSTLSGPRWKSVAKLRKFWSWEVECVDRGTTTDEDVCGLTTTEKAASIWGIDLLTNDISSPVPAAVWKESVDLSTIVMKGEELPPAHNLGIDESHRLHGRKPNLLLILADDLGVGDTGVRQFNGDYDKLNTISTPNLQKMANKGVSFTQAYSVNAVCLPSRYSMLVGRHAGHSRVRGNSGVYNDIPLVSDDTILPSVLRAAGYKTALVGKWGLGSHSEGSHPIQKGFDYFYGQLTHLDAHACFPVTLYNNSIDGKNNAEKYGSSDILTRNSAASEETCGGLSSPAYAPEDTNCDFVQDVFANRALEYMEDHVQTYADGNGGLTSPFFLYLSLTVPHVCSWSSNYKDNQRKVAPYVDPTCVDNLVWASNEGDSERGVDTEECKHKSLMENYIDRDIGRIMDLIDAHTELKNTLVVFVGDNGPERQTTDSNLVVNVRNNFKVLHSVDTFGSTNGHRGIKRELYEGSLLTPMIWYWKGVTSGVVSETPTTTADIFTTFADVAGLNASSLEVGSYLGLTRPLDSISLVASIDGNDDDQVLHRYLYFEYCHRQSGNWNAIKKNADSWCSWSLMIRSWKLMYDFETEEMELFDISSDPYETENLYVSEDDSDDSVKTTTLLSQQATMECVKTAEAYVTLADAGFSP